MNPKKIKNLFTITLIVSLGLSLSFYAPESLLGRLKLVKSKDVQTKNAVKNDRDITIDNAFIQCHLYEEGLSFVNQADYVITKNPVLANEFSSISSATPTIKQLGDRNGDNVVRICVEGGNALAGPVVYKDNANIDQSGWVGTADSVTIFSDAGSDYTVFESLNNTDSIMSITDANRPYTISGLTFRDASAATGAALNLANGDFTILNNKFENNTASQAGGAIYVKDAIMNSSKNIFSNNHSTGTGGAMKARTSVINLDSNQFIGNESRSVGAAIFSESSSRLIDKNSSYINNRPAIMASANMNYGALGGTVSSMNSYFSFHGSNFENNLAGQNTALQTYGAAINGINPDQNSEVIDSSFINNESSGEGGAIWLYSNNNDVWIRNSSFNNNKSTYGGAIGFDMVNLHIFNSNFGGNTASQTGGAVVSIDSSSEINASNFESNKAFDGGAMRFTGQSTLDISDSNFNGNTTTNSGGTLSFGSIGSTSYMNASNLNFSNNKAYNGGAIALGFASALIKDSSFHNNSAAHFGGAIFTHIGSVQMIQNDFKSNSAINGGAMYIHYDSDITLNDVILNSNVAQGQGGGIFAQSSDVNIDGLSAINNGSVEGGAFYMLLANLDLHHTKISENYARNSGGAIESIESEVNIENSILNANYANTSHSIRALNSDVSLNYVTVAGNTTPPASIQGLPSNFVPDACAIDNSTYSIENTIFAYNFGDELWTSLSTGVINYSDFYDTLTSLGVLFNSNPIGFLENVFASGNGNITVDPMFVGDGFVTNPLLAVTPSHFDYHLASGSQLIDSANPLDSDFNGTPADIGAYGGPNGNW